MLTKSICVLLTTCLVLVSICALGADRQTVNQRGTQVTADQIKPALMDYLLKSTSWKQPEIETRSVEGFRGIELPENGVTLNVVSGTAVTGRNGILALIEAVQDGKGIRSFWVTAAIRIHAEVVTAGMQIPQGKRIALDDVVRGSSEISDIRAVSRDPEDVIGKVSRRAFSPGDPLTRESLSDPFLIRHGDTVQLRFVRNGIVLTSSVRAEQNGRLGQFIRVRNVEFSSVLKARVTGRAEVSIE